MKLIIVGEEYLQEEYVPVKMRMNQILTSWAHVR
jgi:hypothetical protein